jgi:phosphoribosylformimino-5-aminoimidazole carboxamide ribotide isomerase
MSFEVIPAIDLRGGKCVRLMQGDYDRETVYGADPVEMALRWQSMGAPRLHVVDLDGARSGEQANADAVKAIVKALRIPVELGGGIRNIETVERWLDAGVDRVYLGTAAVTNPHFASQACAQFPGQVAAGADARNGRIAVRGWEEESSESVREFCNRLLADGACALTYTNIARDGTLEGPDIEGITELIAALGPTDAQIILSGGVGKLEHVTQAARVRGLDGIIVGRALYEGTVDLAEAIAAINEDAAAAG